MASLERMERLETAAYNDGERCGYKGFCFKKSGTLDQNWMNNLRGPWVRSNTTYLDDAELSEVEHSWYLGLMDGAYARKDAMIASGHAEAY